MTRLYCLRYLLVLILMQLNLVKLIKDMYLCILYMFVYCHFPINALDLEIPKKISTLKETIECDI